METKNIKIKQITSVLHKQKVGLKPRICHFSSEMDGLFGLDKEKGNLLIHVGSISKKYE